MIKHLLTCLVLVGAVACSPVEQQPAPQQEPAPQPGPPEGARIEQNVQVVMRDGIRLNTLVVLPAELPEQGVPAILVRTPYKSELSWRDPLNQQLIKQGYAIIMQHERGRYFSEGEFKMLGGALNDGWDTLDWIVDQSWSNGAVGTYGCSSSGENQMKLASAHHPAHKAMVAGSIGVGVAQAGPFREQGNFWLGGVWQQGWMDYFYKSMYQDWPQLPPGLSNEQRQKQISFLDLSNSGWRIPAASLNDARMHLPMIDIMDELNSPRNEVPGYLKAGPVDASWSENRISEGEMIKVPGLFFESQYDISARSSMAYLEWNRQANAAEGRNQQVVRLTQGGHCSFGRSSVESEQASIGDLALGDMRYDYVQQTMDWFNRWMKPGSVASQMEQPYSAYLGYGQWLKTEALPMQGNQAWHLTGDGNLVQEPPTQSHGISFKYDPANPVPSIGGDIGGVGDDQHDGAYDQRKLHDRDDVIVFTSSPLNDDLTLFGMAEIGLTVSSDRPDTDFTVKINEVFPDGQAFNLGQTIMRMRYRDGLEQEVFMQPDELYPITLPPIMLSRLVKAGHRIQVEVSSSNFPAYSRNLNTADNPYTSTEMAIATNTIHLGGEHSAAITLPVITGTQ